MIQGYFRLMFYRKPILDLHWDSNIYLSIELTPQQHATQYADRYSTHLIESIDNR